MKFEIGDVVKTTRGKVYILRSFFQSSRHGPSVTLQPVLHKSTRHASNSKVDTLTLVRSRELTLAYHYATLSDRPGITDEARRRDAAHANRWLTMAEQRNVDSRAALCLASDRMLEMEAIAP